MTNALEVLSNHHDRCMAGRAKDSPGDGVHGGDGLVLDDGAVRSGETRVVTQARVQDGRVWVLTQLHELHVVQVGGGVVVPVRQQRGLLHPRAV